MSALRRRLMATLVASMVLVITVSAAAVSLSVMKTASQAAVSNPITPVATVDLAKVQRVPSRPVPLTRARQVPVLVYHEMDNNCAATAPVCHSHDYESVSTAQFQSEMAWMYSQGYHTVTLTQYLAWLANKRTLLPPKPFLITVDNGISDFLDGSEPVLYHFRYVAVAFLITGFANAASGQCSAKYMPIDQFTEARPYFDMLPTSGPNVVDVQPGCPSINDHGWDLDWQGIRALSPKVYSFGIEAGQSGHYKQAYAPNCYAFDACRIPGETNLGYEQRVETESAEGIERLTAELGKRFNPDAWVVPFSDLGYACQANGCPYENYTGPHGWLVSYAASHFEAVFVQDTYRNGVANERFRYEIHGLTTLHDFQSAIKEYLAIHAWKWS